LNGVLHIEPGGKDGQPPQNHAFCLAEQLAAPLQHRVQALVMRQRRTKSVRQKPEPIAKVICKLAHVEDFGLRGGQFQC
jgi:hypothetical protein